jgi:hypothetical protein
MFLSLSLCPTPRSANPNASPKIASSNSSKSTSPATTSATRKPAPTAATSKPLLTAWLARPGNNLALITKALRTLEAVVALIAAGLAPLPETELLATSRLFLGEIEARIQARQDFAFETTLSDRSNLKLIHRLEALTNELDRKDASDTTTWSGRMGVRSRSVTMSP